MSHGLRTAATWLCARSTTWTITVIPCTRQELALVLICEWQGSVGTSCSNNPQQLIARLCLYDAQSFAHCDNGMMSAKRARFLGLCRIVLTKNASFECHDIVFGIAFRTQALLKAPHVICLLRNTSSGTPKTFDSPGDLRDLWQGGVDGVFDCLALTVRS